MTNFKKALILAAALIVPGIAAATPATISFGWQELNERADGTAFTPASYLAQCGFDTGSLETITVEGTRATWDTILPANTGTVYCGVQAVDEFGQTGDLTMVDAGWEIEDIAPPGKVIINLDIQIEFQCPDAAVCTVTSSTP